MPRTGRHSGWSEKENQMLWETADEAQQQGLPLKAVFERVAEQTGRRPNSIRNYYYAQVRQREDADRHPARFVPFAPEEVEWLMEQVLIARAAGQSVRSCLQKLSGGDHSLMLRYQNKYRAVIKNRPDLVREMVDALNAEGIACEPPEVNHRTRASLGDACERLSANVAWSGDAELVRAIDTLAQFLQGLRPSCDSALCQTANELICVIKDYLARPLAEQENGVAEFCDALRERIGALEACLPVSE